DVIKICVDLRLLTSGPQTGFAEIVLPDVEPGSSIMPGKVNPSVPEAVQMACYAVLGGDHAVALAAASGELELNVRTRLVGLAQLLAPLALTAPRVVDPDLVRRVQSGPAYQAFRARLTATKAL